MKTFSQSTFN